jgi:hypothetical protein
MARYRRSVTRIGANRPRRAERQKVAASRAKPSATMGAAFVESAYIEIIVMSGIDRPRAVH